MTAENLLPTFDALPPPPPSEALKPVQNLRDRYDILATQLTEVHNNTAASIVLTHDAAFVRQHESPSDSGINEALVATRQANDHMVQTDAAAARGIIHEVAASASVLFVRGQEYVNYLSAIVRENGPDHLKYREARAALDKNITDTEKVSVDMALDEAVLDRALDKANTYGVMSGVVADVLQCASNAKARQAMAVALDSVASRRADEAAQPYGAESGVTQNEVQSASNTAVQQVIARRLDSWVFTKTKKMAQAYGLSSGMVDVAIEGASSPAVKKVVKHWINHVELHPAASAASSAGQGNRAGLFGGGDRRGSLFGGDDFLGGMVGRLIAQVLVNKGFIIMEDERPDPLKAAVEAEIDALKSQGVPEGKIKGKLLKRYTTDRPGNEATGDEAMYKAVTDHYHKPLPYVK